MSTILDTFIAPPCHDEIETLYHVELQQGESLSFQLHGPRAYLQSIHGRFHAVTSGAEKEALTCGDGAFIRDETNITLVADTPLRALLIDLPV